MTPSLASDFESFHNPNHFGHHRLRDKISVNYCIWRRSSGPTLSLSGVRNTETVSFAPLLTSTAILHTMRGSRQPRNIQEIRCFLSHSRPSDPRAADWSLKQRSRLPSALRSLVHPHRGHQNGPENLFAALWNALAVTNLALERPV
jgi:hypothetical protein